MFESMISTLHLVLSVLGLLGAPDPGVVGVAVAIVAITLLTLVLIAPAMHESSGAGAPHPRRAKDISTPLSQSDPDASGHPRPRAPQLAASVA
jgi:hypothetical protein